MNFTMQEYLDNIKVLKRNKENVPKEILETKYAKPYNKLKETIRHQAEEVTKEVITSGMRIMKNDNQEAQKLVDNIQKIIDEKKEARKEIGRLIFKEFKAMEAMNLAAEKIGEPCWEEAYAPYFRSKCHSQDGIITCDLLPGMKWNEECGVWISDDNRSFTLMMSPYQSQPEEE